MSPRIMASSPEISMTPIRMMSRRVIGMTEFASSASSERRRPNRRMKSHQPRHLPLGPQELPEGGPKSLAFPALSRYRATAGPPQTSGSAPVYLDIPAPPPPSLPPLSPPPPLPA